MANPYISTEYPNNQQYQPIGQNHQEDLDLNNLAVTGQLSENFSNQMVAPGLQRQSHEVELHSPDFREEIMKTLYP